MVRLELVTEKTFKKIVDMKLTEEQSHFVAPNVVSLAQAWLYYDETRPYAVCDGEKTVGFMMLDWDENERTVGIWRFMIASEYQKMGYGKAAVIAAVEMIKAEDKFDLIHLDYVKGNTVARDLYYKIGFRENGEVENGEIIMIMPLTDTPKVGIRTADDEDEDELLELITKEKKLGTTIPQEFLDEENVKHDIETGLIKRLTIMGKAIGIAKGTTLLIANDKRNYLEEAKKVIQSKR